MRCLCTYAVYPSALPPDSRNIYLFCRMCTHRMKTKRNMQQELAVHTERINMSLDCDQNISRDEHTELYIKTNAMPATSSQRRSVNVPFHIKYDMCTNCGSIWQVNYHSQTFHFQSTFVEHQRHSANGKATVNKWSQLTTRNTLIKILPSHYTFGLL